MVWGDEAGADTDTPVRSASSIVRSASITLPPPAPPDCASTTTRGTTSPRRLDRLREAVHHLLRDLELRASVGAHLLLDGDRLRDAGASGLVGLGLGQCADLRRLLHRALVLRLPWFDCTVMPTSGSVSSVCCWRALGLAQLALRDRGALLAS